MNRISGIIIISLALCFSAQVSSCDEIIHYGFGCPVTLPEMVNADVSALGLVPYEKELCQEARNYNIKILPYISVSRIFNSLNEPLILRHPFWKELDASHHPEWFCITENGKVHRYWGQKNYVLHPGFDSACRNHQNYIDAVCQGIDNLMKQGCSGVFIDENYSSPYYGYCFGDKLKVHTHDWPSDDIGKNTKECFLKTMRGVQNTVKKYGSDKIIIRNGSLHDGKLGDYIMLESFSYNLCYIPTSTPGKPVLHIRQNLLPSITYSTHYPDFIKKYADYDKLQDENGTFSALTYVPEPCSADEYPFVAYAYAKMINLKAWSATCFPDSGDYFASLNRNDIVRRLYRAYNLGEKLTGPVIKDNYIYATYEKGIVVINPQLKKELSVNLPIANFDDDLAELRTGRQITAKNGHVEINLEPNSAYVIQSKANVVKNYLREIKGELISVMKYVEDNFNRFKNPKFADKGIINVLDKYKTSIEGLLADPDKLDISEVDRLSCELSNLEANKIVSEVLPIIKEKSFNLKSTDIKQLVAMPGAEISEMSLFNKGPVKKAILRSAGVSYLLPPYGLGIPNSYLLQFSGDAYLNLASGPIYMANSSARETLAAPENNCLILKVKADGKEYVLNQFEDLKAVIDTSDKKRLEGVLNLRKANAVVPVTGFCTVEELLSLHNKWQNYADKELKLKVSLEVEKGSPLIHIELGLTKNNIPVNGNISLEATGNVWQISPGRGLTASVKQDNQADWVCYLPNPEAVTGNIFMGKKLNIKNKEIVSQENGKLDVHFTHIRMDQSFFIEERLRNIKLNIGLIAQIMHGMHINIKSPVVAGRADKISLEIVLDKSNTKDHIEEIKPFLSGELIFTKDRDGEQKQGQRIIKDIVYSGGKYSVNIGDGAAINDILAVKYGVDITLNGGIKYRLENFKWIRIGEKNEYSVESPDPASIPVDHDFKENADL